jgi:hypothetical protein
LDGDVSGFRTFARREDDVFTLGEEMSWREACRSGQDSGGRDETPAGKEIRIVSKRLILLRHVFFFFVAVWRHSPFASESGMLRRI